MKHKIDGSIQQMDLQNKMLKIIELSSDFNYENGNEILPEIENIATSILKED